MRRGKVIGYLLVVGFLLVVIGAMVTATFGGKASKTAADEARFAGRIEALQKMHSLGYAEVTTAAAPAAPAPAPAPAELPKQEPGGPDLGLNAMSGSPEKNLYLIKTAALSIEVSDARAAQQQLVTTVQAAGGYIGNLQETVNPLGQRNVTIQIRVPADTLDATLAGIEPIGKVLSKQVNTQDVSEEYVDTDSRARNLKKTEERLLDHLNKSARLEDTLKLEQELSRVREEIERLEGRLRLLGNRIQYATLQVTLQEAPKAEPIVPPETFSSSKIASEAARSLVGFSQRLWSRVIWIGVWGPVWLPVAIIALLVCRRVLKSVRGTPVA